MPLSEGANFRFVPHARGHSRRFDILPGIPGTREFAIHYCSWQAGAPNRESIIGKRQARQSNFVPVAGFALMTASRLRGRVTKHSSRGPSGW